MTQLTWQRLKTVAALAAVLSLSACSSLGVKPWQRDLHARADMQEDAMMTSIDEHVFFSKEASSGGRGFAGGGCGCN